MKCLITVIFAITCTAAEIQGQAILTLTECHERAEASYPLIKQKSLIAKSKNFSIKNASKALLPQIMLSGQATYQSDVTQIPVEMPGIEPLSKDQYKVSGEISQTLYNGGMIKYQKELEEINGTIEEQKLGVELYQIKNRVNDLFLGILFLQEQIAQSELVRADIASGIKKTQAAIAGGVALKSAGDVLTAESLRIDQRIIELQSTQSAYRKMLGLFIDQDIDSNTVFEKPSVTRPSPEIRRPELSLYDNQKASLERNRDILAARRKPKVDLFVQGGYGRPALNMLENKFDLYYIGGVRFSWLLSGFYTLNNEKQILDLRGQSLDVQKETFLFNTNLTLGQQNTEISKLERLIQTDREIITLRVRIRETASIQLEEGTITSADYIRELNAEDQARQNLVLHETQLLMATIKHQFISGN
jgi:outer membrane protein TolC